MNFPKRLPEWIPPSIIYIMFGIGLLGHIFDATHDFMMALTPLFLLGMGMFVIHRELWKKDTGFIIWIAASYAITFTIEVIGVKTGLVFGEYSYGETLGLMILDVPLVIGFNWVLVVVGSVSLARLITKNRYIASIIGGLTAMIFDIFLEPVAIELDYWSWTGGSIPVQNYIAWFIIAALFSFTFLKFELKSRSRIPIVYLLVQAVFFLLLRLSFFFMD